MYIHRREQSKLCVLETLQLDLCIEKKNEIVIEKTYGFVESSNSHEQPLAFYAACTGIPLQQKFLFYYFILFRILFSFFSEVYRYVQEACSVRGREQERE